MKFYRKKHVLYLKKCILKCHLQNVGHFTPAVMYKPTRTTQTEKYHIDDWVQDCSISSALALEILQSCNKPLILQRIVLPMTFETAPNIDYIDDLVQYCSISIANALEILQSYTKPSMSWLSLSQMTSFTMISCRVQWVPPKSLTI